MTSGGDLRVVSVKALLLLHASLRASGDLPVHCLHHQLVGEWDFFLGPPGAVRTSCGHQSPDREDMQPAVALAEVSERKQVVLQNPNIARTGTDDNGRWTIIYDEAFEVNVDGLSFLAFSKFDLREEHGVKVNVSHCGETQLGWYRDLARNQWGCYYARKRDAEHETLHSVSPPRGTSAKTAAYDEPLDIDYHFSFAETLNSLQSWWTAKVHDVLLGKSLRQLNEMAGIFRTLPVRRGADSDPQSGLDGDALSFLQRDSYSQVQSQRYLLHMAQDPPQSWNWGNVSGVSYLDDVLDQGQCGSCYVVATTRMLSARHRIKQRAPRAEAFSINFPLYCSEYNQGCNGGYAFLVSRWSQDVGLVPSSCDSYQKPGQCALRCHVNGLRKRWRADNHHYVGGFYGGATEKEMILELTQKGPLVASIEPKPDIMYYSGGIYSSVPNQRTEWEQVDHALLLVGYGEERGQKYWLLQNSWGEQWGEDGYIRMARGTDESGIESIVVGADVVEDEQPAVLLNFAQRL